MLLAGKVWHYWLAVPLAGLAILAAVATIGGYLAKVVRPKYPPRGQQD